MRVIIIMQNKISFSARIFLGLILGIAVGAALYRVPEIANVYIKPLGDVFLNLIRFIVAPVVFLTVVSGIISMDNVKTVGKTGVRALIFYFFTTAAAVVIGLGVSFFFRPFFKPLSTYDLVYDGTTSVDFIETLVHMFPSNFAGAFADGNMMQIIIAALFFGLAILSFENKDGAKGLAVLEKIVLKVMDMILKFSPIGVFALIVPVIAQSGIKVLGSLFLVLICAYTAFILHILLVYMPLLYSKHRISPVRFVSKMLPAVSLAFSTASSVSAMHENLTCAQGLGAKESVADFVIPLGATVNMDGTGIYQGVCVTFIAACFGVNLTLSQCVVLTLSATLASVGTAGVPGAGMIMLAVALQSVGLPVEGVALVAGIDRLFDMGRTAMNVMGDAACAIFISPKRNV